MTHSLEVAHVGIYVVETVFKRLQATKCNGVVVAQWKILDEDHRMAISSFVETACLVHDLGNPPFGHFGEKAIRRWFAKHENDEWFKEATKIQESSRDFLHFDGNMQGFRILTRLQRNANDDFGLNLTATQLASTVKYPKVNPKKPEKCGYFEAEATIKNEVWRALGLSDESRHPCSLLMEAADDIAYCVSDLEDALEKGLVDESDLGKAFDRNTFSIDGGDLTTARTTFTNNAVAKVADNFIDRLVRGEDCTTASLVGIYTPLERQKAVTREKVYSSRLVLANEVTGFAVIGGLLDQFARLFQMEPSDFKRLAKTYVERQSFYSKTNDLAQRYTEELGLLSLLSRKYTWVYLSAAKHERTFPEMFHRVHLIVDSIAGMTDQFALETFRLISGQILYGHRR